MTRIQVPELSLVVMVGPSGSGKSTFARKHFKPTEVLSSDFCRGLVSDDENDQAATNDAFEVLHYVAGKRLRSGRLTVVDATNVQRESRKPLVELARAHDCLPVAIVLALPERLCHERNQGRPDRDFGPHVVRQQTQQLRRSIRGLRDEGFRQVWILQSPEDVDAAVVERQLLWNNRKHDHGPFDLIGDVHGCREELETLLAQLGYARDSAGVYEHPAGRRPIFLGDLVDRGPDTPGVLRLVMDMVAQGRALAVPGNHDVKLMRKLRGRDVKVTHGLAESLAQLESTTAEFKDQVATFVDKLVSHLVLDDGKLVVSHAGVKEAYQGRGSGRVRDFCLFGETTGETDEYGLPVRYNWAGEYRGRAMVVYGHTPVPEPEWLNNTICLDTGCVFGGRLTAMRYPERDLVSVPAARVYYEPARPLAPPPSTALTAQQTADDLLDAQDVLGKRQVTTRLHHAVTIREENALAALEVMSRFAVDPRWLVYLPPTMSPSETTQVEGLLEHPAEAFAFYARHGVAEVVCEEKHMGSRAVVIVCRDPETARRRFGVVGSRRGTVYTRTGRPFFSDAATEAGVLDRIADAVTSAGLWDDLATDWLCLDAELLPWSAKAGDLLRHQYAAVGAAAAVEMREALAALEGGVARNESLAPLRQRYQERAADVTRYVDAYGRYCWEVASVDDLRLAPFHVLAGEDHVYADRDHVWHMTTLARMAAALPSFVLATPFRVVPLADAAEVAAASAWWEELTGGGGEGMVVKPRDFIARDARGTIQPALKCRGPEYLRIIYGPEYARPENLARLRHRAVASKRSLALREFALGIEGLERFVRREPLRRVHECVFGVLALESEPVDPRL